MTNGIVSIRKDGQMLYKVVVGHDGQNASKVASRVRSLARIPTVEELATICAEEDFGCNDCLIILENDPENWNRPKILKGKEVDWDDDNPEYQRYYDTFHVAEFNPRWKFGIAPYVEVIDYIKNAAEPGIVSTATREKSESEILHLWTDEEVAKLKADGVISQEPPTCIDCGKRIADCNCVLDIPF
jgi:hypothetical protein